jgi:hypothetical protein
MTLIVEPICFSCKHYDIDKGTCDAFLEEIPDEIYLGDNDHSKPLPDQKNDIVFEPHDINRSLCYILRMLPSIK